MRSRTRKRIARAIVDVGCRVYKLESTPEQKNVFRKFAARKMRGGWSMEKVNEFWNWMKGEIGEQH